MGSDILAETRYPEQDFSWLDSFKDKEGPHFPAGLLIHEHRRSLRQTITELPGSSMKCNVLYTSLAHEDVPKREGVQGCHVII